MACSSQVSVSEYIFEWKAGITRSYEWTKGNALKSDAFYAGAMTGSRWEIHLFPVGDLKSSNNWISCHVVPVFGCPLIASCELKIFANDKVTSAKKEKMEMLKNGTGFIFQNISSTNFIDYYQTKIYCILNVEESKRTLPYFNSITALNHVLSDIYSTLENNKCTDVTLLTKDAVEIEAHRLILVARSNVFSAMFEHDTEECRSNRIEIADMHADELKEMIRYIYSGKVSTWNAELAMALFTAGDKYNIACLKEDCSSFLRCSLTDNNAPTIFALADMHNDVELKEEAKKYILRNKANVLKTDEWEILGHERLDLVGEIILSLKYE